MKSDVSDAKFMMCVHATITLLAMLVFVVIHVIDKL
jgi:hypothetical protein